MSKIATYIRKNLQGEVILSASELKRYSHDGSIFEITPQLVIQPRNTTDVRKVALMSWQLAEQGKSLPITARGAGTDRGGAALGMGVIIALKAHMNKLIELDTDKNYVVAQPGMLYSSLQTTLYSHGRFLPPSPSSADYSTIGGAVANNASGHKTVKYGDTKAYVTELEVVLSNGEVITTKRLSKRELNRKKGLTNFEGEVYRQLDGLIVDNQDKVARTKLDITKNVTGYNLRDVRDKDGSFDLTPLFVGAQGTLGIITKVRMRIVKHQPKVITALVSFKSLEQCLGAVPAILGLKPSAVDFVDGQTLKLIDKYHPNALNAVFPSDIPGAVLLVEFDDEAVRTQQRKSKKLAKLLVGSADEIRISDKPDEIAQYWQVRESINLLGYVEQDAKVTPVFDDVVVAPDKIAGAVAKLQELAHKYTVTLPIYGHAGDGHLKVAPLFNLASVGDRQKIFKLSDEYYKYIIEAGGSISGALGDGRVRAPYLPQQYGDEVYQLLQDTKKIFDPYNIMNPGVKIDVTRDDVIKHIRPIHA